MASPRVRFAPSPTGALHIGGVRTALYNYLFAKKHGGTFVLRIEDTDQTRFVEGAENYIQEALAWLGIEPEEGPFTGGEYGPYRQSERKAMYAQFAHQLVKAGHAYYAFDTAEELSEMRENLKKQGNPSPKYDSITRQYMKNSISLPEDEVQRRVAAGEPHVIRIKMPRNEEVKFEDVVRGWVSFRTSELDDKVLLKTDGMPTYHLANIVDDHHMKITHVIRGEEWLSSTPLHVLLYRYLGWEETMPAFAHLPLILKPDGKGKLSKRDGAKFGIPVFPLEWNNEAREEHFPGFREAGYDAGAVLNFLALLGWSPAEGEEILSKEEMVAQFALTKVNKAGARFDADKAKWFNHQYLMRKSDEELAKLVRPHIEAHGHQPTEEYLMHFCRMLKERANFLPEFWTQGSYFFEQVDFEKMKANEGKNLRKKVLNKWDAARKEKFVTLRQTLEALENFEEAAIKQTATDFMETHELKFGDVLPVLRMAVSGTMKGPAIFEMLDLLGKSESLARLDRFYAFCDEETAA